MRIGEIAIVGPDSDEKRQFIESMAHSVEIINNTLTFGQFFVNKQFVIHLYGIALPSEVESMSWDLIAPKLMGYITIFKWGDSNSFRQTQKLVDEINSKYDSTIIVAGHSDSSAPVPAKIFQNGFPIEKKGVFTFCNVNDPASVKKVLLTLVDSIILRSK